ARYNGFGYGEEELAALALDTAGNAYVTGRSWSTNNSYDFATVKYDPNGNQLWATRFGSTNGIPDNDAPFALGVDGAGDVYVTGSAGPASSSDFATIKYQQTNVAGLPVITSPPQGQLVVAGSTATFSVAA